MLSMHGLASEETYPSKMSWPMRQLQTAGEERFYCEQKNFFDQTRVCKKYRWEKPILIWKWEYKTWESCYTCE